MARIRTVKPEFFRHEKLQELGPVSMLVFQGLWTQCDKAGRFAWKPRLLKLDILPFLDFDMETELQKLADALLIIRYEAQKEFFGVIPTFLDHQRISGKEAQDPAKYPDPPQSKPKKTQKLSPTNQGSTGEALGKQSGSDGDQPESQEGKGKEGKGKDRAREVFEEARKAYPGSTNGPTSEWENFEKKNPEVSKIAPLLLPAIRSEVAHKAGLEAAGRFVPSWKNFKTWINNRCWEQSLGDTGSANGPQQSAGLQPDFVGVG